MDYDGLFSVTLRNDNVQEIDTRSDEILLIVTKIPPDDVLESLYKWRIRESAQLKTVLELYDMEKNTDQKLRLRIFDARNEKIETGAVVTSRRGLGGWKRKRYKLPVERKKPVFERRPMQFPAW